MTVEFGRRNEGVRDIYIRLYENNENLWRIYLCVNFANVMIWTILFH